jgi:hypothetical protein
MTGLLQKPRKWRWTKTAKLRKSINDSIERAWAKNWYAFRSNFDYEILHGVVVHLKKIQGFPHVSYI